MPVLHREVARAVEGFVAALGSGTVASLGDIDSDEARDLIVSSYCVNVQSFRASENGSTVALDLVGSRVLRSALQVTESLPDRWVLTMACEGGGCRVKQAVTKAEAIAVALRDAPENERERILDAEAAGDEAAISRSLARHGG